MITDPIQVTVLAPTDQFLGLTSTAWTAIGSIVSAGSVIAFLIFNSRFLHFAREQADASIDQAKFAKASLETLQSQILTQQKTEHLAAYAVLARCAVELVQWRDRLTIETRIGGDENVKLIPEDWNSAVTYVSREFPDLHAKMLNIGSRILKLQSQVNGFVRTNQMARSRESSLAQMIQQAKTELDKLSFEINQVMSQISR
jgi:hypothetical protein